MKSFIRHSAICAIALFFTTPSFGQTADQSIIKNAVIDYFLSERESVHLHLDKDVFTSSENIWFKGYVLNQKTKLPFGNTSNIFVEILDSNGQQMSKALVFASGGYMSGNIKLNNKFPTGRYFIRVFTNWMNNFREDESSVFPIIVINEKQGKFPSIGTPDYTKARIEIHAEGGSLVSGISNNVGLRISDCAGRPLPIKEGEIVNEKGEVIRKVFVNRFGYGKFDFVPGNETYKAVFNNGDHRMEAELPKAAVRGIALEVNNYSIANKSIIKIKVPAGQLASLSKNPLLMLIQQGSKASFFAISFENGSNEQELTVSNDYLYEGTNTIRIIDSEMKQIAERIIFKYPGASPKMEISRNLLNRNKIVLKGASALPNANISISVLPENSQSMPAASIQASLWINPYIENDIYDTAYYFDNPNKAKHFELDLMLLQQVSKYKWDDIIKGPPPTSYDFDYGLTINGTITQPLPGRDKYKVRLYSLKAQISEISAIDDKNGFAFKNLVVGDSSFVKLSLVKLPDLNTPLPVKLAPAVSPPPRLFNKNISVLNRDCHLTFSVDGDAEEFPMVHTGAVMLDNVEIESKTDLKRANQYGNSQLRGYKVVPENSGMDVLDYIKRNGFNVEISRGNVFITGQSRTTINGQPTTPVIYIDNMRLMGFDELWGMLMDDVDEIYLNAHAIVPSVTNNIGVIRIYRKWLNVKAADPSKDKTVEFHVMNGYARISPFINADYRSNSNKGFENYGLIHWQPTLLTGDDGSFSFEVPATTRENVKLLIEGMTPEGKLISEFMTVRIKE